MLKNRLKELSKKGDNSKRIEIIKDSGLSQIRGGKEAPCSVLTTCGWNNDTVCPKLTSCDWHG
jgi:hypothetical protein